MVEFVDGLEYAQDFPFPEASSGLSCYHLQSHKYIQHFQIQLPPSFHFQNTLVDQFVNIIRQVFREQQDPLIYMNTLHNENALTPTLMKKTSHRYDKYF